MWKKRIAWLLILAAALGVYLFENNAGTRILLASVLLLPLCSALGVFLPRPELSARLEVPETLARGAAAQCGLLLQNGAPLPLPRVRCTLEVRNLLTGERSGLAVTRAVNARRTASAAFTVEAAHCGKLSVRVVSLEICDVFGLWARKVPCEARADAPVPPIVRPVTLSLADTANFLPDSLRYSAQKPGYDPSETFRVREYAPGDPIRQIHWKLSQKTDCVLVREFGLPVADRMLLLLETTALERAPVTPENMDAMLDLLFSVSESLLSLDVSHTVGWQDAGSGGYEYRDIHGGDDWAELRELLLSNAVTRGETTVAGCWGRGHIRCAYAHVAVFSPYLAPDLSLLCHGNRVTALLPCEDASPSDVRETGVSVVPFAPEELRRGDLRLEL